MKKILPLAMIATLVLGLPVVFAQTQSHPISQISPVDTDLNMNSRNISSLNYLLYSGGIFYSGSQGIPSADIASSAVTGAKIASSVVTASKLSNPLGGSVNGSAYYDSDNSDYYLDSAGVGISLNAAGDIIAGGDINTSRFIYGTTPSSNLVLYPAPNSYVLVANGAGGTVSTVGAGEGSAIATYMPSGITYPFTIYNSVDNSNPIFRVLSTGKVGIGSGVFNTGIEAVVDIDGAGDTIQMRIVDNDGSPTTSVVNVTRINNVNSALQSPNNAMIFLQDQASNYPFHIQNDTGGAVLTVKGNKIGIGSITPVRSLDIVGDLNVTGTIYGAINTTGDVNCTGCVDTADIANSAVTSSKISDSSITSSDLSNPLGGSVNATAYYDSDNSNYYADLASSGTSIQTAGTIRLPNNVGGIVLGNTSDQYGSTQIFTDTSDRLKIIHGNINPVLAIESDGDVGIGTVSPANRLHVKSSNSGSSLETTAYFQKSNGQLNGLQIRSGDGLSDLTATLSNGLTAQSMSFSAYSGATTREIMRMVGSSGYVGINTTTPGSNLHISDDTANITLSRPSNSRTSWMGLRNAQGGLMFQSATNGAGETGSIAFDFSGNSPSINTNYLTIMGSGRIGINETSPDYLLHLSGVAPRTFVEGTRNGDNVAYTMQALASDGTARGGGYYLQPGTTDATTYLGLSADNSNYHMVVTRGGQVGIGTSTPDSNSMLQVVGRILSYDDTDNINGIGLQSPGGNRFWISANSSSSLKFTVGTSPSNAVNDILIIGGSNGLDNVGISQENPSYKLAVNQSTAGGNAFRVTSGTNAAHTLVDVTGSVVLTTYPSTGTSVRLTGYNSGGSPRVGLNLTNPASGEPNVILLPSGGNVGIGTNSPTNQLHVLGSGSTLTTDSAELLRIQNSGTSTNAARISIIGGNAGESAVRFGDSDSRSVGGIYYDHSTNNMTFFTNSGLAATITSSGRLGLGSFGTLTPNRMLDLVDGSIQMRQQNGIFWWNSNIDNAAMGFINFSAPGGVGGRLIFGTNGAEAMRIDDNRRLGIGVTTPAQTLAVAGSGCVGDSESDCDAASTTAGNMYAKTRTGGAIDVAEWIKFEGAKPQAGDVLCIADGGEIDNGGNVKICSDEKSKLVVGIVSTKPHMTIGEEYRGDDAVVMAIAGRVPVNVEGQVSAGDILVSGASGKAVSCSDGCEGATIGKAITGTENGKVLALVSIA